MENGATELDVERLERLFNEATNPEGLRGSRLPWVKVASHRDPRFGNIPSELRDADGVWVGAGDTSEIEDFWLEVTNAFPAILQRLRAGPTAP